ncbi:MAG: 5-(carboxyamino)imidazole ribonucleotide mutase, partial [Spirochaetae bacterium HGW-Spirochaetae-6]
TLRRRGIEYRGVLFAGLMMTQEGPKVLEFNCRFGDPETQVLMPLLETDLALILEKTVKQELHELEIELSSKKAVCFVAAAGGYPGDYKKGTPIHGLDKVKTTLFYAGVKEENKLFLTNGGRVLGVVALGKSIEEAREKALYELEKVSFEGMQVRKDIGIKEVKRPKVAVMMGSDSDLPVVAEGLKILEILEIPFEVHVLSAHRSPEELLPMAKGWKYKDLQIVIAAAGMAAHLPGVLAGHVDIPVIGIPIESKLQGLDALYSIVQMPAGVPVATVTLGKSGAKNAALLAAKILALKYPLIAKNLKNYQSKEKTAALEKEKLLQEIGYRAYLESKKL